MMTRIRKSLLSNMNLETDRKRRGFTIVELLVVIVVIGILASITIVSFNGIQSRARTTKAQANASAVQKSADAFSADQSRYPGTTAEFATSLVTLPAGISLLTSTTALSGTNGESSVDYDIVGTAGAATGARIQYWDFGKAGGAGISTTVLYLGNATSGSTFVNIAS